MPATTSIRSYPNRYAGPCVECDTHVPEWTGQIARTSARIQQNGRHAFELRCIACGGFPNVDQRQAGPEYPWSETTRPLAPSTIVPPRQVTPRQCTVDGCLAEPLGMNTICTRHREEQQAERTRQQAAEREARVARLRTEHDLTQLPRPSRNQLYVFGSRDGTVAFRIWMSDQGDLRIYGGRNVTRNTYNFNRRHIFPDIVAVQGRDDEHMRFYSDAAMDIYSEQLQQVLDNPRRAIERWGLIIGHCGHCGRTLTNPESIERGIGPVCYSRMIAARWSRENPNTRQCMRPRCTEIAGANGLCVAHHRLAQVNQSVNPPGPVCVEAGCTEQAVPSWTRCSFHQRAYNNRTVAPDIRRATVHSNGVLTLDELGHGEIL